jgi:hypothetical protein
MTRRKNNAATVTAIHEDAPTFPEELDAEPLNPAVFGHDRQAYLASNQADAAVPAPPVAAKPVAKPRLPAERRVRAEVVKAETKLLSLERRRQESLAHHEEVWASKRAALLQSFPDDVHAALVAMGVLVEAEDLAEPAE